MFVESVHQCSMILMAIRVAVTFVEQPSQGEGRSATYSCPWRERNELSARLPLEADFHTCERLVVRHRQVLRRVRSLDIVAHQALLKVPSEATLPLAWR